MFPPSRLTINLQNIQKNYNLFSQMSGQDRLVAAAVKANGYGLGAQKIVEALDQASCPLYFVATLDEALELRAMTQKPIATLNGLFSRDHKDYTQNSLIPILHTMEQIEFWGRDPICFWQVDTGINRLGLTPDQALKLVQNGYRPQLILSHFACADEETHPTNAEQIKAFREFRKQMQLLDPDNKIEWSFCNSSALFYKSIKDQLDEIGHSYVRTGIALYGGNPTPDQPNPVLPVVEWDAVVLQVQSLKVGQKIGYGSSYTVPNQGGCYATCSVGYADGLHRSGSNRAKFYWQNTACPIVGRISMDLTVIDVSKCPYPPQVGDYVEILGKNQDCDQLAHDLGTISYEVLTSLKSRSERIYL
jgi:alanine racemase